MQRVIIDDILVFSSSYSEHEQHLRVVLTVRENQLYESWISVSYGSKK
jgi:hypothetical protein